MQRLLTLTAILCATILASAMSTSTAMAQSPVIDVANTVNDIRPFGRQAIDYRIVYRNSFDNPESIVGWRAANNCQFSYEDGRFMIESTGDDPYIYLPPLGQEVDGNRGPLSVQIIYQCNTGSNGQLFWTTEEDPLWSESKTVHYKLKPDGESHECNVTLPIKGRLQHLRLDPGTKAGHFGLDSIKITEIVYHPIELISIRQMPGRVVAKLKNHSEGRFTCPGMRFGETGRSEVIEMAGQQVLDVAIRFEESSFPRFGTHKLELQRSSRVNSLDKLSWNLIPSYQPDAPCEMLTLHGDSFELRIAKDASGAEIVRDGKVIGVICPFFLADEILLREVSADKILFDLRFLACRYEQGRAVLEVAVAGDEIHCSVEGEGDSFAANMDGEFFPMVQAIGSLEQGILAGVEYLGCGERSSSKADIETPEHMRHMPDLLDMTMPLMAYSTDRGSLAMTWVDMQLEPTFASPNFLDGTDWHLMSLWGMLVDEPKLDFTIRVGPAFNEPGGRIEDAILWAVKKHGLPPLPGTGRTAEEQRKLTLAGMQGPIFDPENGYRHAFIPVPGHEDKFPARWSADHLTTMWHLGGSTVDAVPDSPELKLGGSHHEASAIYFLQGKADQWLADVERRAAQTRQRQQPDGSFRYQGKYLRGHFEDTASGYCAMNAWTLLRHAELTGDKQSLAAGVKTLEYMRRFRTPRGAQIWELSLHTPDILGSAWCCGSYVLGYELTGKQEYLDLARRWAITGLPFVYQWEDRSVGGKSRAGQGMTTVGSDCTDPDANTPVMRYATIAVYGATNWTKPNWIGLPVQWCGIRYADMLTLLAEHDDTLPWRQIARGILVTGQQMQYPMGDPSEGTLPDVFELGGQERRPADISPSAIVSLERMLDGLPDDLVAVTSGQHTVAGPMPMTLNGTTLTIQGQPGLRYQIVVDGKRIVTIDSVGEDLVELND